MGTKIKYCQTLALGYWITRLGTWCGAYHQSELARAELKARRTGKEETPAEREENIESYIPGISRYQGE